MGLLGMIDPPRPEAKAAVETCKKAGIKAVMITGDHIVTASAIARELGILNEGDIAITGAELDNMTDEELSKFDAKVNISAKTGDGMDLLEKEIANIFPLGYEGEESVMLSNVRQYECLVAAQNELSHALENIGITADALLSDIERAVEALGEMTGKTVSEEIIDNIFSRFCVGK